MANQLSVEMQQSIISLFERVRSRRKVADMLGVNRRTVSRYIDEYLAEQAKCTTPSTGSEDAETPKCTTPSTEDAVVVSACEPFRKQIELALERKLTAQRIYQDLVCEHDFQGSYKSVQRFVRKINGNAELPKRRMECEPGHEAQVDFGQGAPVVGEDGRRRRPHLFRVVLSHSRKGYSEVVPKQSTEHFIRALENAFRHFGGAPATVVPDNLLAAVKKPDWYDPELQWKIASFARHYGTVVLPTKVRRPELKGKVERGVGYAQCNALKGRTFRSIAEQNAFLLDWEINVADTRIHGTTRKQVKAAFEAERPFLAALPPTIFPAFEEGKRRVHRDQHVEVDKSYYSTPPEYLHREVWVRYDTTMVRIYNLNFAPIACHPRVEPGLRATTPGHILAEKISGIERGEAWQLRKAAKIGPQALAWAKAMLGNRGLAGIRVLQGLLSLPARHSAAAVDAACGQALSLTLFGLRDVKSLIKRPACQQTLQFLEEHELIRDLSVYSALTPWGCSEPAPEPANQGTTP